VLFKPTFNNMELPVYKIVVNDDDETGVDFVSLVDRPAIQKDFMLFSEQFVEPGAKESEDEFMGRCIPYMINEGYDDAQAAAVCYSKWDAKSKMAGEKISIDYDDTLSTERGKELVKKLITEGADVYIISARGDKEGMMSVAAELGIAADHVFATGSNTAKIEKVKELGIVKHYDNNADVTDALGKIGAKFESYSDYPEAAKENAKIALRWAEENGWGDCGEATGKIRANQLANGMAISRETIARMASFERHRQNSQKELGDGCGRLMWLAWGGDEGIEWASRKLQQIDMRQAYAVQSEEKRIVTGPAMLADLPIYRYDDIRGEYYVTFDADTIWKIAKKFVRNDAYKAVNTDHANPVKEGVHMIESYFIDRKRGVMPPTGYEDAKDGSWFLTYLIDNEEIWAKVKDGEWKGFSVEGLFDMEEQDEVLEMMREITAMLKNFA
jgi:Putative phage serine protease XkdF